MRAATAISTLRGMPSVPGRATGAEAERLTAHSACQLEGRARRARASGGERAAYWVYRMWPAEPPDPVVAPGEPDL